MPTTDLTIPLSRRLRTVSDMINMGEKIAWGSETALMDEAADALEAAMQRERQLWGCLQELVLLKEHKDINGKTPWYECKQPNAWDNARKALHASEYRNNAPRSDP